ncbi:MAG: RNA-directed DNA polymerase [Cognatishimia sp.]|uniref:RNA-directed DNA polymerase n=1 Tax=Cognatishimia sp. TaxID=2211648 RepID=UPI003B8C753B
MVTLKDLGIAFRKAKVDLYYSSHPSLDSLANFEEHLYDNLQKLQSKIQGVDESWVTSQDWVGTWTVAPKSVDISHITELQSDDGNGLIFSSPTEEWKHLCSSLDHEGNLARPKAEFRIMGQCSMEMHVLSTLWIQKVGHKFDGKLTDCAYGNRLRRGEKKRELNPDSLGSFKPYLKPFRDWRDNGIAAMQDALAKDKQIIAITADVSSFYHELNPGFMLEQSFISDTLNIELNDDEEKLHRLFIRALQAWAKTTPIKKGLPVGLPASAIVANVALIDLDRIIEEQVVPIYYGRYVDDILLIMENGSAFNSTTEIWNWLFARSDGNLDWSNDGKNNISFEPEYLKINGQECRICFANSKNKVFVMSGDTGKTLVSAIVSEIRERSSEWRAMPNLPAEASEVGSSLVVATQSDGEAADNLRKADALTTRRAAFAMKLRDIEAFERDLSPEAWQEHRTAFLRAFREHILVLPNFFELSIYLPRVIKLAVACEEFLQLRKMLNELEELYEQVTAHCEIAVKASDNKAEIEKKYKESIVRRWKEQLFDCVQQNIAAAFPPRLTSKGKKEWDLYIKGYAPKHVTSKNVSWELSIKEWQALQAWYFSFDLAHLPFRFSGLPSEIVSNRGIPAKKTFKVCQNLEELLPQRIWKGVGLAGQVGKLDGRSHGLAFATRPYNLAELNILSSGFISQSGQSTLTNIIAALRGFKPEKNMPAFDKNNTLVLPAEEISSTVGIAVSSWQTNDESFVASVKRKQDLSLERYSRLARLVDGVIAQPKSSRYLVLPELSLPANWFIRIARKLQGRGVSLISGVEYIHARRSTVRNQVWASLVHDGLGFPSLMIYRQDKQRPALHEEAELHKIAGLTMKPSPKGKWDSPPIIQHGDFRFSILVCSELTNISYRTALRGKVDALFVPEWNQDIETFNALVESAALDIHAYVIQCNNRRFGDSRIRAPFKDSWRRDLLRVKGGILDYCVVGEIDPLSLRQFQSNFRSPAKPFKPLPDGFQISHSRKVLPA